MAALTLETLDIVNPDLYVQRGYPHEEWALLRKEAPVFRYSVRMSNRSGPSPSTPTS